MAVKGLYSLLTTSSLLYQWQLQCLPATAFLKKTSVQWSSGRSEWARVGVRAGGEYM